MTVPDEPTGLSRRSMLKRSALAGGTLLWVTPTVTVLAAGPAAAGSDTPRGDGTPLKASYYILAIRCGTTKYLIKVNAPDSKHPDSFWLEYGPNVKGANGDPNDGWPKAAEPHGIAQEYRPYALDTATPPSDVAIYVVKGMLYLDLDVNRDGKKPGGAHCELLSLDRPQGHRLLQGRRARQGLRPPGHRPGPSLPAGLPAAEEPERAHLVGAVATGRGRKAGVDAALAVEAGRPHQPA